MTNAVTKEDLRQLGDTVLRAISATNERVTTMDERLSAMAVHVHRNGSLLEDVVKEVRLTAEGQTRLGEKVERDMVALETRLGERIALLEWAVLENSADIRKNSADIQKNSADIQKNSADIQKNSADIQKNSADIRKNSADIQKNSADIQKNSADIRKNSADIEKLASEVADLRIRFGRHEKEGLIALEQRVAAIEEKLRLA